MKPDSPPKQADATLGTRTMAAAQWRLASAVAQALLQFGVGVLLARLLPPHDFGLVALAIVVVGLASLVADLGLGPAVIQRKELTERHLRAAFTASVLLGCLLALLLVLASPLLGPLLRSPELPRVLRVQSLLFVLGGLGVTARALLSRHMRASAHFAITLASYLVGYAGVGTALALAGYGVWALVWGALMQALLESLLSLAAVRPPLRPLLARAELRDLFGFGATASLNSVVNYVARNGDNLLVGRWLGEAALGLYGRAYNLMTLPLNYVGTLSQSVLFPAMSRIQDDRARLGRAYLAAVQVTALAAAPVMAGMAVAAPHLAVGLYGARWAGLALPLQVLCAAGLLRAVYHVAGPVAAATGQIGLELRRQVVYAVLVVGLGFAGTRWGITGVAVGVTIAIAYMYLAMTAVALRITGRRWADFFAAQAPGVVVAGVVGAAALAARVGLERAGTGSGWVFAGVLAACAAAAPLGVYLLPARVRPVELFTRLAAPAGRLPRPLSTAVVRMLRLSSAGVEP